MAIMLRRRFGGWRGRGLVGLSPALLLTWAGVTAGRESAAQERPTPVPSPAPPTGQAVGSIQGSVRTALAAGEPGTPSPYQRAALAALRDLTGRDAAPTAEAWRKLLDLPVRQ